MLNYFGGKSTHEASHGAGKWVLSMLPDEYEGYCEPFGGLCGILLARKRASVEIVNDLNELVVDFWRCVQHHPDELRYRLENTPRSRRLFDDAIRIRENKESYDLLARGWAATVLIKYSRLHTTEVPASNFAMTYVESRSFHTVAYRVSEISERMRGVALECIDACVLLDRLQKYKQYVIYVDPPYRTANAVKYYGMMPSFQQLRDVLLMQKGKVAVSGYGDEWDDLGWDCYEHEVSTSTGKHTSRIEKLWVNYKPTNKQGVLSI